MTYFKPSSREKTSRLQASLNGYGSKFPSEELQAAPYGFWEATMGLYLVLALGGTNQFELRLIQDPISKYGVFILEKTLIHGDRQTILASSHGTKRGRVSQAAEALSNLPAPFSNITQLSALFASKDVTVKDIAVLSGAHTIGISHCTSFSPRLYNFTGIGDSDPSMNPKYVAKMKQACKPNDATSFVEIDPGSFKTFDSHYYTMIGKRGVLLFNSDSALLADPTTKAYVRAQTSPESSTFLKDFGESMMNIGRIGVLTGCSGEIRKHCALVN